MSTVHDEPLIHREEGRKLYEDADKLLRLAEELQDKCERIGWRLFTLWGLLSALTMTFWAVASYLVFRSVQNDLERNVLVWVVLAIFYAVLALFYLIFILVRILRQLARDKRALRSIVDMLRDLEKGIAETNNLSTLERAEFRIRLSRFDIGPG